MKTLHLSRLWNVTRRLTLKRLRTLAALTDEPGRKLLTHGNVDEELLLERLGIASLERAVCDAVQKRVEKKR